jgi:hypothetical protein
MPSFFVGYANIAALAHYDAVRRGHPIHQTEAVPEFQSVGQIMLFSSIRAVQNDFEIGRLNLTAGN